MTTRYESRSDSPRQVRALRTREAVLAAAASVFDRHGFAATRLNEIAVEADVTRGALYFHFQSKSEIAASIIEQHHDQCATLALDAQSWGLDGVSTLERFIDELAIRYQRDAVTRAGVKLGNEYRRIGSEVREPYVDCIGWVRGLLDEGRNDGTLDAAVDPTAAARIIVGSVFGILEMSAQLTGCRDAIQRIREWFSFIRPTLTAGSSDS
jgi:AcrR family transcriptional regulator